MDKKYDMSFAEAQDFCTKIGLDIPWNDGDVAIDNRHITESIANAVKWSLDNHLEKVTGRVEISGDMYSYMDKSEIDWEEYNKEKIAYGIVKEMLKNNLIDFEQLKTPDGNVLFTGTVFTYKKSEK